MMAEKEVTRTTRTWRGERAGLLPIHRRPSLITHHSSLITLVAALALVAAACYPGAYPVDVFQEMHYQQSQRRLEPDRLAPPPGAVPVTGRRPAYTFDQAASLQNSIPRTEQTLERAREIYRVNCAMCHGQDGRGTSVVAEHFARSPLAPVPPVDLASPRVRARTDGELYWVVANGLGNMPPFGDLLTEEELWTVVHFMREVQGR